MNAIIIYIMGVAGSGKTLIGQKLSAAMDIPFFDGDDFHSIHNKEKMHTGLPLTDDDRKEWLLAINRLAQDESANKGAIIACSALKEKYRVILAQTISVPVHWIFLQGDYELIRQRMNERKDHFMPAGLLASQFEILEMPANAIVIDIKDSPAAIVEEIVQKLHLLSDK